MDLKILRPGPSVLDQIVKRYDRLFVAYDPFAGEDRVVVVVNIGPVVAALCKPLIGTVNRQWIRSIPPRRLSVDAVAGGTVRFSAYRRTQTNKPLFDVCPALQNPRLH